MIGVPAILCGIIILLFALHYYYNSKFDFWIKRSVPGPKPIPFFGTTKEVILNRISLGKLLKEVYDTYKEAPLVGIFYRTTPMLIVKDPLFIKDIFITNATVFGGRGIPYSKKADPLLYNLFLMNGKEAQYLRTKISPVFTSTKLKSMVPLLLQRAIVSKDWLDTLLLKNDPINCSDLMQKLTADFSTMCMFGYDIKSLCDEENKIINCTKSFNHITWKNIMKQLMKEFAMPLYDLIGNYVFDNAKLLDVFIGFANDIMEYRKRYGIVKHDIASVLMDFKENPGKFAQGIDFTNEFIAGGYFIFFLAAFETTAATISNILYELALNQNIQNRLREEIRNVYLKTNGEITFDDVKAMPYLDAVFKETLRKYPIAQKITRSSSSVYTFRNTKITIPKDQLVIIPIYAIHYDPEIYPEPEIFDPERFFSGTTQSRQSMLYMPFGHGPRNCIGERFGILQTKIELIILLQNYKFHVCEKTLIPYVNRDELVVEQSVGIYLRITKCI